MSARVSREGNPSGEDYRYAGTRMSFSSVLIVVGGIALWLLWPEAGSQDQQEGGGRRWQLVYGGTITASRSLEAEPLLFVRQQSRELVPWPVSDDVRFVGRQWVRPLLAGTLRTTPLAPPGRQRPLPVEARRFQPVWRSTRVLERAPGDTRRIVCRMTDSLHQAGVRLPEVTEFPGVDGGSWDAELDVVCGPDGRLQDVFIRRGPDNQALREQLVRFVEKGTVAPGTAGTRGQVVVMWGFE